MAGFDEKIWVNKDRKSRRREVCEILFVIQLEPVRQVLPFDWFTTDHLVSGESTLHWGRDPFNQNSNRSDREKRTTSKGGPVFPKLFRLDRTDPLSFGPKFPESLVEWIAPWVTLFSARSRIFLPIAQSYAALFCCRLAIRASSLGWLVGNKYMNFPERASIKSGT